MYKNYFKAITMALATSIFVACNKEDDMLSPNAVANTQNPAQEEAVANCSVLPANTQCPAGAARCGCSEIAGLGARKAAYITSGRAVRIAETDIQDFLGKAGLETPDMNPYGYPYGDVYPNRDSEPWATRDRKKTGYAANGGAIKQNVYVIAASINGYQNTVVSNVKFDPNIMTSNGTQKGDFVPTPCPAGKVCWNEIVDELNRDRESDMQAFVASRNRLRVVFGKIAASSYAQGDDPWSRMHRGGSSYLTLNFISRGAVGTAKTGANAGTDNAYISADALHIKNPSGVVVSDGGWSNKNAMEALIKADTKRYITATEWIEARLLNGHTRSNIRFWVEVINI